jgi:putative zinc finger/helix-turn-helix YgiT family protein
MNKEMLAIQSPPEAQESQVCPNCGSKDIRTTWIDDTFSYGVGANPVQLTAHVPLRICTACNFEYYDEEAEDLHHEAVCRHLGVQTPAEVQALREKYGLSRAEFANLTKLGEATIARWERGALIQNTANDRYLRLLHWEENLKRLRDMEEGRKAGGCRMSECLQFECGEDAHNDYVMGYLESWERARDGGGYRKGRDFFSVHWQVNVPKAGEVSGPQGVRIIRLHVESPRATDDPLLNAIKRDLIKALLASTIPRLLEGKGYGYEVGRRTSNAQIQQNKSTEAFRVVLAAHQGKPTSQDNISLVHDAIGSVVDEVVQRFAERLNQRFDG